METKLKTREKSALVAACWKTAEKVAVAEEAAALDEVGLAI